MNVPGRLELLRANSGLPGPRATTPDLTDGGTRLAELTGRWAAEEDLAWIVRTNSAKARLSRLLSEP